MRRVPLVLGLLMASLLGGCLDGPPVEGSEGDVGLAASPLQEGTGFSYRLVTGTATVFTFDAVAVREDDGWRVAPDQELIAAFEAAFDVFPLGAYRLPSFTTERQGEAFDLYRFPLRDGAGWTGHDGNEPLVLAARWAEAIATADGPRQGFEIVARDASGALRYAYDLVLETGWMSRFVRYEGEPGAERELYRYDIVRSATAVDAAYVHDVAQHVRFRHAVDPGAVPALKPGVPTTFEVQGSDHVFLWVTATTEDGLQNVRVEDPEGRTYEVQSMGVGAQGGSGSVLALAVPGTWRITTVGAAAASHATADAWELQARIVRAA